MMYEALFVEKHDCWCVLKFGSDGRMTLHEKCDSKETALELRDKLSAPSGD